MPDRNNVPPWVKQVIMYLCIFVVGGGTGAVITQSQIRKHEGLDGHKVMVERVNRFENTTKSDIKEIKESLRRLLDKLDA